MSDFVVPRRFRGPAESGNGGWTSGHVAVALHPGPADAVRVVLRQPPPLDRPLQLDVEDDSATVIEPADGSVVLRAERLAAAGAFEAPAPTAVGWTEALAAAQHYGGWHDHPFPSCFTCGTDREEGDGLRLTPGHLDGTPGRTAAAWVPHPSLAPADAEVCTTEVCWAALDCPGGWSVDLAGRPMVLGTMTAQVGRLPRVGVQHVVVGAVTWVEGRKAATETALYEVAEGKAARPPLARASAIWIAVDPASVRPTR